MKCTKAIILIAGYGTRRLPITKVIEKCMLPILNRPVVDYVVEDCIKAGITDIYFVISKGATQIRDYYQQAPVLESYLQESAKVGASPLITPSPVRFHFVEQDTAPGAKYGTTVPVWLCRHYIKADEHVLVLTGDDFIYNADGSSEVARLIAMAEQYGTDGALLSVEVPLDQTSHYGVLVTERTTYLRFVSIQEKPAVANAKSRLINVSKYLVGGNFFAYVDQVMQHPQEGEYQITDPLNAYVAAGKTMAVVPAQGVYLDSGTVEHWLYANQVVAKAELEH
jgi:UTP--glucose-1-phosphate uridylyltransferase